MNEFVMSAKDCQSLAFCELICTAAHTLINYTDAAVDNCKPSFTPIGPGCS
jgi:hypothetical protein